MRDHKPITITDFRGLFDRGEEEGVPKGFFISSQNNRFIRQGFKTREGSSIVNTIASVRRIMPYKRENEAMRHLILDGNGHIYDSLDLGTAILTISAMTDFSIVSIFNRAYISPHNGFTGLPGEKIYVYEGSGLCRQAGGAAPSAGPLSLSDSTESGFVESGLHLVGVCFESSTGFISPAGCFNQITNIGGRKLNVGSIPIGPAQTVARVLIGTKSIFGGLFNGDYQNQTYYFIPNGRIANNTDTQYNNTLSFFDADLFDDASYLLDLLATIPAGVGIGSYNSRMIVWGEDQYPSMIRVSAKGEPEAFDATEGFVTINPGDASTGVRNCFEHNTMLICQKSQRSYYTQDNDNNGAFWPVRQFDAAIGAECHSVAQILDYGHEIENMVITGHISGLRLFNGTFNLDPLTSSIDDIWARINKDAFHTVEVIINPYDYELFVVVPLDGATSPSHILYGNFNEGLTSEAIKWDIWKFPKSPTTIEMDIDFATKEAVLKFGSINGDVHKMDELMDTDFGSVIDAWAEMPLLPDNTDDEVMHFTGTRVRVRGTGILDVTVRGLDNVLTTDGEDINLSASPGKAIFSGFNFTSERCAVKFRVNSAGYKYLFTKYNLYAAFEAEQK
jgi:hypothetical protein